jgi:hypothetical protein
MAERLFTGLLGCKLGFVANALAEVIVATNPRAGLRRRNVSVVTLSSCPKIPKAVLRPRLF